MSTSKRQINIDDEIARFSTDRAAIAAESAMDEELQFERAKSDPEHFAPLFHLYYPQVLALSLKWLGNAQEAQDATSEIFKRTWLGRYSFTGGSFRKWLFTIAINVLRDLTRSARPFVQLSETFVDGASQPEREALQSVDAEELYAAILRLEPEFQAVVLLRMAGHSSKDVAARLGRTDGWVRKTHSRALNRLKTLLDSDLDSGGGRDA